MAGQGDRFETTEKVPFFQKHQRSYAGFRHQISGKSDFFSGFGQVPCSSLFFSVKWGRGDKCAKACHKRDEIIKAIKSIDGVTVRQLSRITGISKSTIDRI